MKLFFAAPQNLLTTSHLESALKQADISPSEILISSKQSGSAQAWMREWAKKNEIQVNEYDESAQALKILAKSKDAAVVAVVSPDHPETLDLVSKAESMRIPVYVYRELYRRDPRVNCRFSPVERPDVWLKALTAEQRDFFRRLHSLCSQYGVKLSTPTGDGGGFMTFADGTEFEGVELDPKSCRVRPRGSLRYRKIPLD
jgi:hypothetical protein